MTAPTALPQPESIAKLLGSLFDKRIVVARAAALPMPAVRGICDYIDAERRVLFVIACDMALLAGVGAALAMIPAATVAEAVKSGKLSDSLRENAYEVLNIAASMFNDDATGVHVKLRALTIGPPIPPELLTKMAKPTSRMDLDVTVPGYPLGKLSLLAVVA